MDCAGLFALAQATLLFPWVEAPVFYDETDYREATARILPVFAAQGFAQVKAPVQGDFALMEFDDGCAHMMTFLDPAHVLHVFEGRRSRVSPWHRWAKTRWFAGIYGRR